MKGGFKADVSGNSQEKLASESPAGFGAGLTALVG